MTAVFIVSACRSAIGSFGGSLAGLTPAELGSFVAEEALVRAKLAARIDGKVLPQSVASIDEVIVGNVLAAGHGMNLARQVAVSSGCDFATPSFTINKVCGSGLKAITLGCSAILIGEAEIVMAGGVENMSAAAFVSLGTRWGNRLGHTELRDLILQDGLTDVFRDCHMGITAENLAEKYSISRAEQDAFALESQRRAGGAIGAGHFKTEIVPIPLTKKGKVVGTFGADEFPRPDSSLEALGKLAPAFKRDGTVTAGNASGINDGAAMVVLASEAAVRKYGLNPLARVVAFSSSGVAPEVMGLGPVGAVRQAIERAKLKLADVDLIEANEAFAAQALAVGKELEWDPARVNVCGGAIALGHPIGASGARIMVTLLHQLTRTGGKLGLATLCVGGGQGIAAVLERV